MKKSSKRPDVAFFNQMAGPLFRELAEDISAKWPVGELFTGHPDTVKAEQKDFLRIISGPNYERGHYLSRLWSWFKYLFLAFFRYLFLNKNTFVFLVPFPPFLDLIAYFFKRLRRQRYAVLIYDIYPDTLINFGPLKESGFIAKIWRKINRVSWENAEVVFTIGYKMAENLETMFDPSKTSAGKVIVIPNWASTDWIKPLAKEVGVSSAPPRKQQKMMSLFLFYQPEHQLLLNRLVEELGNEIKKVGAVLRAADFKDV